MTFAVFPTEIRTPYRSVEMTYIQTSGEARIFSTGLPRKNFRITLWTNCKQVLGVEFDSCSKKSLISCQLSSITTFRSIQIFNYYGNSCGSERQGLK